MCGGKALEGLEKRGFIIACPDVPRRRAFAAPCLPHAPSSELATKLPADAAWMALVGLAAVAATTHPADLPVVQQPRGLFLDVAIGTFTAKPDVVALDELVLGRASTLFRKRPARSPAKIIDRSAIRRYYTNESGGYCYEAGDVNYINPI